MTKYAGGLRASAVVQLRSGDIDSARMLIHVKQGKCARDRLVPMSPALVALLREYSRRNPPEPWLFVGQDGEPHLNFHTVQSIVTMSPLTRPTRRLEHGAIQAALTNDRAQRPLLQLFVVRNGHGDRGTLLPTLHHDVAASSPHLDEPMTLEDLAISSSGHRAT